MKSEHEIETLLTSGKSLTLPPEERDAIKASLLAHATESLQYEISTHSAPWHTWLMRGGIAFASCAFVFTTTLFASQNSLPGEALYLVKVHVTEEVIGFTKFSPEDKIAYDISLMEERLNELKILSVEKRILDTDDIGNIERRIDEHIDDIEDIFNTTSGVSLARIKRLEALNTMTSIAKAQEMIAENDIGLASLEDHLEESRRESVSLLQKSTTEFTKTEPIEEVSEYLSERILDVGEKIHSTQHGESVLTETQKHLNDSEEALIEGDVVEAIVSVLEAQQTMLIEEYLSISEETMRATTE
jgi:hypothetical protein